jgi:hypothetical protein
MINVTLKRFDTPDEIRVFPKGRVEIEPHDSWVIGDKPYVSLHLLGADRYATT